MGKYRYLAKNIGLLALSNFATKILSFFLVPGHDNLKEVFQINGYFFHPVQLLYGKY